MGAEVLWRMTKANVFWEYGKYASAAVFLVALLSRKQTNKPALVFIYFLLLLPSAVLTVTALPFNLARMDLSYNLSGPFALMVCSWFFANLELTREDFHRLWRTALGPIVGIASIALYSTLTATEIYFTDASNFVTSGGFGPNQVASALGLGALFAFLYILTEEKHKHFKAMMFVLMLFLASQSALTFSRGGLWIATISGLVVFLYLVRDKRARFRALSVAILSFAIGQYVLLPQLDAFTGGALSTRFRNLSPTNRDLLMRADLAIFKEYPFLGVGPGMAFYHRRAVVGVRASAHTEITRLLAEHGLFGLVALFLLLTMGWKNFQRERSMQSRGIVAGMVVWSLVYMLGNAMRTVAPSFAFGLSFAKFNFK
ncbi:MAG: O-antigen ligase family protein [Candidatus Bathyarchaeia archaeon]